jgi:SpoVK/Ycf46/Vps4 family AAA+-type ATPase
MLAARKYLRRETSRWKTYSHIMEMPEYLYRGFFSFSGEGRKIKYPYTSPYSVLALLPKNDTKLFALMAQFYRASDFFNCQVVRHGPKGKYDVFNCWIFSLANKNRAMNEDVALMQNIVDFYTLAQPSVMLCFESARADNLAVVGDNARTDELINRFYSEISFHSIKTPKNIEMANSQTINPDILDIKLRLRETQSVDYFKPLFSDHGIIKTPAVLKKIEETEKNLNSNSSISSSNYRKKEASSQKAPSSRYSDEHASFSQKLDEIMGDLKNINNKDQNMQTSESFSQNSVQCTKNEGMISEEATTDATSLKKDPLSVDFTGFVGLENVKKALKGLMASFFVAKSQGVKLSPPKLIFLGNQGTGKTTVSTQVAKNLKKMGVIQNDNVIYTTGAELKGMFVGHTTDKISKLFNRAESEGSIIFIDELYALFSQDENKPSEFAVDAMGVLLSRIESLKPGAGIIVAGYPKEMENVLMQNQGLLNRFNKVIFFDDYDTKESLSILEEMLAKNYKLKFSWKKDQIVSTGEKRMNDLITSLRQNPSYGNARTMRNLADFIFERVSLRMVESENPSYEVLENDFSEFSDGSGDLRKAIARASESKGKRENFKLLKKD